MSEPNVLDPQDWVVWRDLTRMRHSVERALEQRLQRDAGLSLADFEILHALSLTNGGRLRAGALADATGWEKSRISHQVRRMVDRGLLSRAECPTDARGTWVVLADPGADAFATASCGYVEVLQTQFFDRIQPDQKQALGSVASCIAASFEAPEPAGASRP
jgi:DNA-binding MarR family transcriptional regulator